MGNDPTSKMNCGTGKGAQLLRVSIALVGGPSSVPNTNIVMHNHL